MTFKSLLQTYQEVLSNLYENREIEAIYYRLSEFFYQIKRLDISLDPQKIIPDKRLLDALQQLQTGKPWQYITGETEFYGLTLKLNQDTLIPRPETETLVDWIISEVTPHSEAKILDIGTGSGAIALALAANLPKADITAVDISENALSVAQQNAINLNLSVNFKQKDILTTGNCEVNYQVMVSNPPYVREQEKNLMHQNVLAFEPHTALFVPDDNALVFYKKIIDLAIQNKTKYVYFEINEFLKDDLEKLLSEFDIRNYRFKRDLFDKWRMLKIEV